MSDDDLLEQLLDRPLSALELSTRTINNLEEHGARTVRELLRKRPEELLSQPNFGACTLAEVYRALELVGLRRGEEPRLRPEPEPERPFRQQWRLAGRPVYRWADQIAYSRKVLAIPIPTTQFRNHEGR